jgi:hypothetical protein
MSSHLLSLLDSIYREHLHVSHEAALLAVHSLGHARFLDQLERNIMTALSDLQDAVAAAVSNTDILIGLTNTLKEQLDALAAAGGATPAELAALQATIVAETAKVTAAVTADSPPVAPPPVAVTPTAP